MVTAVWVAAGGAIGTLARFGLAGALNGSNHPWGTVTVNIVGSLALGFFMGIVGVDHAADHELALSVGALGGFTTFSTFALDTIRLWEDGRVALAGTTLAISVIVGLAAAIAGLAVGRAVRA